MEDSGSESLREICRFLTVPAQSGVYLTLRDMERIGTAAGVPVVSHSRRMAIEQLFRAAAMDERLDELFDAFVAEVESQRQTYRENAPASWDQRAGETIRLLGRMREELPG